MHLSEKHWRFWYKAFRYLGFAGCSVIFVLWLSMIVYYSATRPHVPQPEHEWTVRFNWSVSPPSYGTAHEKAFLISLFWWFFLFFVVMAVGEAIRIYKLKGYKDDNHNIKYQN